MLNARNRLPLVKWRKVLPGLCPQAGPRGLTLTGPLSSLSLELWRLMPSLGATPAASATLSWLSWGALPCKMMARGGTSSNLQNRLMVGVPLLGKVCLLKVFVGLEFALRLAFLTPRQGGAGAVTPHPPQTSLPATVIYQKEPKGHVWPNRLNSSCWIIRRSQWGEPPGRVGRAGAVGWWIRGHGHFKNFRAWAVGQTAGELL